MQLKNLALIAAALSTTATAEFVIITDLPTPTALPDNIRSYISSLQDFVTSKIGDLTKTLSPSQISEANSARTALANFVATATYDIPKGVTQLTALETFTTVPAWYSALPSDVKSYYDANNARVQSLIKEAVLPPNNASATGSKPQSTGAAPSGVVQVIGAGFAAALVGVMAL